MTTVPIIDRACMHAHRIAVRAKSDRHTYHNLLDRSAALAAVLLHGTADLNESRVAFLMPAGAEYVSTQWGIWRAGGIAVPLSLTATAPELEYTLRDSSANIVVASGEFVPRVRETCELLRLRLITGEDVRADTPVSLPEIQADRRAMILYTSGTTSRPKGVVTTHACITAQIESLIDAWQWRTDDRIPLFLPLHHIHGIVNVLLCALWSGAEIEPFARFDLDAILHRVSARAWTVFMAVPTIYVKLIDAIESTSPSERSRIIDGFGCMRLMVSGSAALPAVVHKRWTELTGQQLLERYGMTEIGMALSNPYNGERRPGFVGQPLPGVDMRLQSEDGTTVTEENVSGEIQVRGPGVFLEYWNQPRVTQESIQHGWFRTGDIAVLEDGYYRILGRSSVDIIKSGGYKLSALEIETVLLDHPDIAECAVVGVPDETWGETVAAVVVLRCGAGFALQDLQRWCQDRISHYKIPRSLRVVDQLPRNAMGKVTKPAVLQLVTDDL